MRLERPNISGGVISTVEILFKHIVVCCSRKWPSIQAHPFVVSQLLPVADKTTTLDRNSMKDVIRTVVRNFLCIPHLKGFEDQTVGFGVEHPLLSNTGNLRAGYMPQSRMAIDQPQTSNSSLVNKWSNLIEHWDFPNFCYPWCTHEEVPPWSSDFPLIVHHVQQLNIPETEYALDAAGRRVLNESL